MEAEALPDSTTTMAAVVNFAASPAVTGGGGTQTTTIGMDVDATFPDLFLSNEQVTFLILTFLPSHEKFTFVWFCDVNMYLLASKSS